MLTFFERHLPHYHLPDATYFITIRLAGSLPWEAVSRLQEEYETNLRRLERIWRPLATRSKSATLPA